MRIIHGRPPNYDAIIARFPVVATRLDRVVFCYGDKIFNPGGGTLHPSIVEHEKVHSQRQGRDPAGWWEKYLADAEFRLIEELLAYRREYDVTTQGLTRNQRRQQLRFVARKLASPIYGFAFNIERAKQLLAKED